MGVAVMSFMLFFRIIVPLAILLLVGTYINRHEAI
jgi:hypothetical protein